MKKQIIKWGAISGSFMFFAMLAVFFMGDTENPNYDKDEIIGWSLIFLALGCVILGIKAYRDQNSGVISFGDALKLGVMISVFPAIGFVLYNIVYLEYLDPDFMDNYYGYQLEKKESSMDAESFAVYKEQIEAEKEMWSSPIMQAVVYFFTVFILGFIISLIAAWIMKRKFKTEVNVS